MSADPSRVYHVVVESELRSRMRAGVYRPASLDDEGFVHCSPGASVLAVANDYHADAPGPLLLLEIDPARLSSETRYEAAAPLARGELSHLAGAPPFPHVYGPIEAQAVSGVGWLRRGAGGYQWPRAFESLDRFLAGSPEARAPLAAAARLQSIRHGLRGVAAMLRTQPNAWIHALATTGVVAAGLALQISRGEWLALVLAIVAVWTAEALNTALEALCDVASAEFHPLVERAKDVAAGAVLIAALGAVLIGLLVFAPRLIAPQSSP